MHIFVDDFILIQYIFTTLRYGGNFKRWEMQILLSTAKWVGGIGRCCIKQKKTKRDCFPHMRILKKLTSNVSHWSLEVRKNKGKRDRGRLDNGCHGVGRGVRSNSLAEWSDYGLS